jgi:hypothetical protein
MGYKPIYHLYATPKDVNTPFLGANYPYPNVLIINYVGIKYPIRIPYIVRESQPILLKGKLAIHGAPKGCKGYIEEAYHHIKEKDPTIHIRLCTCEADK